MLDKKKAKKDEEEYFKKKDSELLNKIQKEKMKEEEQERLQELKELHFMHCPKCGHDLEERKLDEVKIDICTHCHGIWLDKGELELLRKKEGFLVQHLFRIFS
ncbi:MAG: hypothetical protein A2161_17560 [Candidatus Schekmanbacteria bacterium RBG_13_48_7]|uniref:Transcription factor zinc-finger domain-containing protein n=1 Tax=Candidatus Schekmanbacteria bacterium RBG_13_48_7 TaxID=1817878 RepID=A0A1F7S165_9BACT|nr:MAG: hypothetical protein A2161_17560 [Candidatus Schekmanbacteria bacterium RBG_13_48_7]